MQMAGLMCCEFYEIVFHLHAEEVSFLPITPKRLLSLQAGLDFNLCWFLVDNIKYHHGGPCSGVRHENFSALRVEYLPCLGE